MPETYEPNTVPVFMIKTYIPNDLSSEEPEIRQVPVYGFFRKAALGDVVCEWQHRIQKLLAVFQVSLHPHPAFGPFRKVGTYVIQLAH